MSVIINLQPGGGSIVQPAHGGGGEPTVLIFDGTSTLVFSPAPIAGGLADAAAFGRRAATVLAQWAERCDAQLAAAASDDPLSVDQVVDAFHGAGHAGDTGPG